VQQINKADWVITYYYIDLKYHARDVYGSLKVIVKIK